MIGIVVLWSMLQPTSINQKNLVKYLKAGNLTESISELTLKRDYHELVELIQRENQPEQALLMSILIFLHHLYLLVQTQSVLKKLNQQ